MAAVDLDDPLDRMVLLANPGASPADKIIALAGGQHQDILAHLEDVQAATMVQAWEQARSETAERMEAIWARTFGSGVTPEPKDVIAWTQSAELLAGLDQRLDDLGIATQTLQGQAWSAGAELGWAQANKELGFAVTDFGGAALVGKTVFGSLPDLGYDLAMTAAINETKNLLPELRAAVHRELIAGATQGEGIKQLRRRLDTVLGGATVNGNNRAELIARWATIKGHNAARDQTLNDAAEHMPGLSKMWLVQRDERTCPHCMAHWGEVVPANAEFDKERSFANTPQKVYGDVLETPPLHPRCRCTITAWHERWRGISSFTPEDYQEQAQAAAQDVGFIAAPKHFPTPKVPKGLRTTRRGRRVINAQNIAQVPDSVRKATQEKLLSCWLGGAG